jgi:carboxymethylenebutenolidase
LGQIVSLAAADGSRFSAYEAGPAAAPHGAVVVLQEVFGVNDSIRGIADDYARDGYHVAAPSLFDRIASGLEFPYTEAGRERARETVAQITYDQSLRDIAATVDYLSRYGRVAVVGYCLGGILAWLAASRLQGLAAASCYYPSRIGAYAEEDPRCPVQLHFAEYDHSISTSDVQKVEEAQSGHKNVRSFIYAGTSHGFNCDARDVYAPHAATLARQRTLMLFRGTIG